jgi:hypothetical protein
LHSPYGLAVDRANNLYATNSNSDTIQKFTPEGMGSVFASSGLSNPFGLAIDSAGNLYTGNYFGSAIRKFTPAGVGSTFAGAPGIPHFMAILPALSPTAFVAGFATPIPGGTGNFTGFPSAPSISGENVAFVGNGAGIVQGVFAKYGVLTPPQRVADTSTPIPGGSGNFTGFGNVSISATDVAFLAVGANGQQGIYDVTGGKLVKVVDRSDILNGRAITGLNFSPSGLFGDPVTFQATFADGSQGVFTAAVPQSADYNNNGIVDAADYVVWRQGLGTTYTQADYDVWRTHFGQTAGSGAGASVNSAVPEPATLVLLMFAAAGWCLRRSQDI